MNVILTMAHELARDPSLLQARRTAFGTFGGKLKGLTATELATHAAKAAIADAKVRTVTAFNMVNCMDLLSHQLILSARVSAVCLVARN